MAITDKKKGVWGLDQTYNKINQGSIWSYSGVNALYMWGGGWKGQGGVNVGGMPAYYSSPVQLPGTWTRISSGAYGSGGLKSDGTLWSWGSNEKGVLGQNQPQDKISSPVQVPGTTWSNIVFGEYCTGAVKSDGTLWMWGANFKGMLGLNQELPWPSGGVSSPTQVPGTTWSTDIKHLSTGYNRTGAIKTDGTLWMWGQNQKGALGIPSYANDASVSSPVQVGSDTTWSKICGAGTVAPMAIKTDGTLWGWGNNNKGPLGLNDRTNRSSPTQVGTDTTWSQIDSVALEAYVATKTDGTLWTWGTNEAGEIGNNTGSPSINYSSPVQIGSGTNWSNVQGYLRNIIAVQNDGTAFVWGEGGSGRLGINNRTNYSSPVQLPGTWSLNGVTSADAGTLMSYAFQVL